ncbi:Hypothetical protein PP7435_CHR2-0302 [Komagataella phaffii CBS 7435]|uniref:Metallothionein n=1 Tax=Komagataella phaffii (strain ATCC 76273 / CBS 7435 / CECT 11047 / NRRL Y-11430 / Wegner 21-1) TaxID=981350 RepID=A0A1G4KPU0_KOMPC|nr:Hypothetical protein BQ9382_C2-1648 [Komagataella phaffii CBS 7435]SCV12000.1 Hypothetical protein PP7435_CHR2-0302 [Komagataella phaffii CBS 7435]
MCASFASSRFFFLPFPLGYKKAEFRSIQEPVPTRFKIPQSIITLTKSTMSCSCSTSTSTCTCEPGKCSCSSCSNKMFVDMSQESSSCGCTSSGDCKCSGESCKCSNCK